MPVVINEFETTAAPQPATPPARGADQQGGQGKDPIKEVEKKLNTHAERSRRLWAY